MYYKGQGVPQDYKEAVRLYRLAADQGHTEAQVELRLMYSEELVIPQDNVLAN